MKLEPCPFCGNANQRRLRVICYNENECKDQVQCLKCGALGPDHLIVEDEPTDGKMAAETAWNRRPKKKGKP